MREADQHPAVHQELASYLQAIPPIRPLHSTILDSSVLAFLLAAVISSLGIFSGLNESVDYLVVADVNYARIAQAVGAVVNTLFALGLSVIGRYQTYRDLRDFQDGVPARNIISRADHRRLLSRAGGWCVNHTHNIVAVVSLPLCGLMIFSGVISERPGEALTGVFLMGAYLLRLLPEKYAEGKEGQSVLCITKVVRIVSGSVMDQTLKLISRQSPLVLSSIMMSWRVLPALVNAIYEQDIYQTLLFTASLVMVSLLANSTKDGMGRYSGSILAAANGNNDKIVKILLEGRILRPLRSLLKATELKS